MNRAKTPSGCSSGGSGFKGEDMQNQDGDPITRSQRIGIGMVFLSFLPLLAVSWSIFEIRPEEPLALAIIMPMAFLIAEVGEARVCKERRRNYPYAPTSYVFFVRIAIAAFALSGLGVGQMALFRLLFFAMGTGLLVGGAYLMYPKSQRSR